MSGKRSHQHGFTLVEVLVALAIVAIGMAAVLGALTSSASTVVYMRDKTLANWVALNHIAEQRLQAQMPPLGKSDGEVEYAGRKWQWKQETVATAVKGMIRMDVSVRPADSKSDEDRGWYATLSGITADALSPPNGNLPAWGGQGPGIPGAPGTPGSNNNGLDNNNNGLNNGGNSGGSTHGNGNPGNGGSTHGNGTGTNP